MCALGGRVARTAARVVAVAGAAAAAAADGQAPPRCADAAAAAVAPPGAADVAAAGDGGWPMAPAAGPIVGTPSRGSSEQHLLYCNNTRQLFFNYYYSKYKQIIIIQFFCFFAI